MPRADERHRSAETDTRAADWFSVHGKPLDDLAQRAYHLCARKVLEEALRRLDAAGIPTLVVKGAVLAYLLYESPAERPMIDIDLRVRPADHAAAVLALTAAPRGAQRHVPSRAMAGAVLMLERIQIDLEQDIGPPFVCAIGVDAMLARAERTTEGLGFSHLRPELHDHALLLVVNLFKDRMPGGRWRLRDLERIARMPGFDVEVFAARAKEAQCRTIAHIVAQYIAETAGDERWGAIAERIPPPRRRYAARVRATLRGERRLPLMAWRIEVRASSDDRLRSIAALGATALRELEFQLQALGGGWRGRP